MTTERGTGITALLAGWKAGDPAAFDRLVELAYPELRRLAHQQLGRRRPGESLESAALASEVYLKLLRAGSLDCESRVHFLALCAQVMRRILVDHARQRAAAKRGGELVQVPLDEAAAAVRGADAVDVIDLDAALEALARLDPRKSRLVELRYFAGLTIEEAARVLEISVETAKRDWRMAKAWLLAQLSPAPGAARPYTGAQLS
jgi:RNA polymerase sigma factor (TIGR02999 family)